MRRTKTRVLAGLAALLLLVGAGCSARKESTATAADHAAHTDHSALIQHVHGLGYTAAGDQLLLAAHDGLRVYANGRWETPDLPAHDYMGFSVSDDGFYSSGHPAPGATLPNPLGLVKSADGGKTLQRLAFAGLHDFHAMAVGYKNHAIYVANPQASPKLDFGIHYSTDEGKTWQRSAFRGVTGGLIQLAVHPTEAGTVAAATEEGLFLSEDFGQSFARVGEAKPVSAVAFTPDGMALLFGSGWPYRLDLSSQQVRSLQAPPAKGKVGIEYLAVNPAQPQEIVLATGGPDLYRSSDGGESWEVLVEQGQLR